VGGWWVSGWMGGRVGVCGSVDGWADGRACVCGGGDGRVDRWAGGPVWVSGQDGCHLS